ncbi:MAG: ABC transporter substrate-binding protein [Spirochaeta sp.]|jgi:peptide/nickel transport system substrate-binding protein|nr:ABC transporter substrate-binding protein [Spirochaeta sp.]
MKRTILFLMAMIKATAMVYDGGSQESGSQEASPQGGSAEEASSDGPQSGGVLVFARSGDSVGLDPARETDGESFYGSTQIFDNLVEFVPGTTEIRPALAESWDIADDGLTFTFHLREGVEFHDGTPFNAEAVKFSFDRQRNEDHPYFDLGPWKYWGYMSMSDIVDDIVVEDEYTVRFDLKKVEAPFLANLAMDFAAIVSPTAVAELGEDFKNNPVGTGPFSFVEWVKDDRIVVERNEDYWRRPAYLDRLVLRVIPDATARFLALQAGEVDVIDFPSPEDLEAMEADPDIELIQQPGLNVGYIAMNNDKEPFGDVLVRRAVNHAINKQDIIDAVFGSAGQPATNPIPPTMWSHNDDIDPYEYDPERARELLAEAGYPDGFETDLWAMPVSRPYFPDGRTVAEIAQANLAEVGIDAEIVSFDWGTYLDRTDSGEHEMALLGWTGDNGDPDNFLYVLLSSDAAEIPAGNIAFWRNDEFDTLIEEAKTTFDMDRRTELYMEAQEVFHDQAPWVPVANSVVTVPVRDTVRDFVIYPTGKRKFYDVWLDN